MSKIVLRKSVAWFAQKMEEKLRENDDLKKHWSSMDEDDLLDLMRGEFEELFEKCSNIGFDIFFKKITCDKKIESLILECADIANYAMMIADNAREKLKGK